MNRLALWLLLLHLLAAAIATFVKRRADCRAFLAPEIWLLPVVGIALLAAELIVRRYASGRYAAELSDHMWHADEYDIGSDVRDTSIIVPVEEALTSDEDAIRYRLLLRMFEDKRANHADLLREISRSDDVELAHYASTHIGELQRAHESRIFEARERMRSDPENADVLESYCDAL